MLIHWTTLLLPALAVGGSVQQQSIASDLFNGDVYTSIVHESRPNHKLRIRPHNILIEDQDIQANENSLSKYCVGATSGYTGYLSTNNDTKHFYFAYFESRSSPDDDPLLMWINGGPGCSSMMGLLMEQGPCRINEFGNGTTKNPSSWVEVANVFFLDQPIGVGFSYDSSPNPGPSNGTFAASEDIYAFMRLWYIQFPKSQEKPFSISGESYAGHYIPIFASHILEENEIAISEGRIADIIPLTSVLIGNGIFDPLHQTTSVWDITCTNVTGVGPVLKPAQCKEMARHVDRCETLWNACYEYPDVEICRTAGFVCSEHLEMPYFETGRNFYDISKPCDGSLCYREVNAITSFLNRKEVRNAFGVDAAVDRFHACSSRVGRDFYAAGDGNTPTTTYTTYLLNKGLRVLIYVGTYDYVCNFVGNERFLLELPWSGHYGYRYVATYEQRQWEGGEWWEFENLRYARVQRAGHMVPYDRPEVALSMVRSWLKEEPLK